MTRRGSAFLLAALALAGARATAGDEGSVVQARAYVIHHRPLADAADLIDPLLSEQGKIILRPRQSTLIVEDHGAVLDRVKSVLEDYDVPPRSAEVSFSLFLGTRDESPGAPDPRKHYGLSQDVRGVLERLSDFTKWTTYEPLGSRSVTGTEGDRVVADLSKEFRVAFRIQSIHESKGSVRFESVELQRVRRNEDGTEEVESMYSAGMLLPTGQLQVVGAAADPNSRRALFLALKTEPR
jgi:hypothetical protein